MTPTDRAAPEPRGAPPGNLVLLTGATGYVGGRLLRALEEARRPVRCLTRRAATLRGRTASTTEIVEGDVLDPDSLASAMNGVQAAYYLVHSMGSSGDFEAQDRVAAENFARAARAAGVRRVIYLGGLGDESAPLSPHLRSRQEVGRILREAGPAVIEFRASIVIGSGSLSFEMIRALVENLPVMVTPAWVDVQAQPIGISDLIAYLLRALDADPVGNPIYEIGGAEPVSYGDLMREYARQRGLKRLLIPVPVLTPRLSSLWLGLVTPLYARVGRKLIDSIRHPTIVRDDRAPRVFGITPMGVGEAIAQALRNEDREFAETRWSDALSAAGAVGTRFGGVRFGRRLIDSRVIHVDCEPSEAFAPIRRIGGAVGWYGVDWLWKIRGFLDLLFGGVGMRRGRPLPEELRIGDTVDWWRVEALEPDRRLLLVAEMKLPGRAWLEFEVTPDERGTSIRQTASFDPAGVLGLLYWYGIGPLHGLVFRRMLAGIARSARTRGGGANSGSSREPTREGVAANV